MVKCRILKHECVGHVKKRCSTHLSAMVKLPHFDGDGNRVRIGGPGRLTKDHIDKLQEYYGLAIKRNTNDLQAMTEAVMAGPYHSVSTDGSSAPILPYWSFKLVQIPTSLTSCHHITTYYQLIYFHFFYQYS